MSLTLIRPYLLTYKNRLLGSRRDRSFARKEWLLLLSILALIVAFYFGSVQFLSFFVEEEGAAKDVPRQFLAILIVGFFALMLFSNFIGSLGFYFYARDLPMVLTFPVSAWQFFFSRLIITATNSGWVFFLFCSHTKLSSNSPGISCYPHLR